MTFQERMKTISHGYKFDNEVKKEVATQEIISTAFL